MLLVFMLHSVIKQHFRRKVLPGPVAACARRQRTEQDQITAAQQRTCACAQPKVCATCKCTSVCSSRSCTALLPANPGRAGRPGANELHNVAVIAMPPKPASYDRRTSIVRVRVRVRAPVCFRCTARSHRCAHVCAHTYNHLLCAHIVREPSCMQASSCTLCTSHPSRVLNAGE